jgi:type I restriction enzyme S subunit
MEVRPGYKLTEVGVVPDDWKLTSFGSFLAFTNGVNADKVAYGTGIRFVNVLEAITYSHIFGPEIPGRVEIPSSVASAYSVKPGDVVFNRTSETDTELGLAAVYLGHEHVVFGGFVIRGRPSDDTLDPTYSGYALRAPMIRRQIIPMGQGAIRANIGQQNLRRVLVAVPPKPEQRAIAATLSDVDALLIGLNRLIAKKRDLKQAAMQHLLTGQTRLPGFHGKWESGNIASVIGALDAGVSVNSVQHDDGDGFDGMFILKTSAVAGGRFFPRECKRIAQKDLSRACLNPLKGTIIISRMNTPDLVGECGYIDRDYPDLFVPDRLWMTRFKQDLQVSGLWLSYLLSTAALKRQIAAAATGTSGSMKNLSKQTFLQIPISLPPCREQSAIAAVLFDMDAEVAALEARRDKTRWLKQGMMQELLTGKTRLVPAGAAHV